LILYGAINDALTVKTGFVKWFFDDGRLIEVGVIRLVNGAEVIDDGSNFNAGATVTSIAAKIGCTAQSLNEWVKKAEIDSGVRGGVPTEIAERLKALERENRELRQANEILRKASAYFAQAELDRRFKP
jgi:transposase